MRKSELLCPEFVMDSAAVEESLWILLQSILADATIDSPRRIKYVFSITPLPRRASQNLMVLLPSHSCGIRRLEVLLNFSTSWSEMFEKTSMT
jgi:hypothetical protein